MASPGQDGNEWRCEREPGLCGYDGRTLASLGSLAEGSQLALLRWARKAAPAEAAGLLRAGRTLEPSLLSQGSTRGFWVAAADLLGGKDFERDGSFDQVVGTWHSHPAGDPSPSAADEGAVWLGGLLAIVLPSRGEIRIWRRLPRCWELMEVLSPAARGAEAERGLCVVEGILPDAE